MKKNIISKKAVSRLFTAFTFFTLLVGNSSFISLGEEIIFVKISTPSRSMIRNADKEINDQFKNGFRTIHKVEECANGDYSLTAQFEAENIDLNIGKFMQSSDNQIFNQFYLDNYNLFDPSIITIADGLITDSFRAANN